MACLCYHDAANIRPGLHGQVKHLKLDCSSSTLSLTLSLILVRLRVDVFCFAFSLIILLQSKSFSAYTELLWTPSPLENVRLCVAATFAEEDLFVDQCGARKYPIVIEIQALVDHPKPHTHTTFVTLDRSGEGVQG